jgi:hypothetical protein
MNKIKDSNDWHTILFPHSHLGEQDLKKILPVFGPISMLQPWFMAPPEFLAHKDYQGAVRILNPPSHMKPEEDFKGRLSEYKTWIKDHQDSSTAAFMKVSREMGPAEESSWEIRESLRKSAHARGGSDRPKQERKEPSFLKWHLILHLARDMEQERQDADRMLRGLKERKSPIEDLLGEEAVKNPLMDLSQFESDPGVASYPLERVFDAWFGLFGKYLKEDDLLLTVSRQVMDYASEAMDASARETGGEPAPLIRLEYPDLSDQHDRGELGNLIMDLGKGHQNDIAKLKEHAREMKTVFQKELMGKFLHVSVKGFSPLSNQSVLKDHRTLKNLSGKVMVLVEGKRGL